ncbi:hypothetical protein BaRGS_00005897, partial [Batillaria attramentaria]
MDERKPILNGQNVPDSLPSSEAPATCQTERRQFSFRELPARTKCVFLLLAVGSIAMCCCFSIIAPMFPTEAKAKEMPTVLIGLVFSCFELWVTVMSPVFGKFMTKIGAKCLLISGQFLTGVSIILFGLLDKSAPGLPFIVSCFTVRSFEAIGVAAFLTSSFTIMANETPDHVTTVFGFLQMCFGAGAMTGPVIGGFLYELGGFGLPFWVVGGLLLTCAAIMAVLLPNPTEIRKKEEKSILRLLTSPAVVASGLSVMTGGYSFGSLDSTLALHVAKFELRAVYVGLLFMTVDILYTITTPLYGLLTDKRGVGTALTFMITGNIVLGVAFLLYGPAPFLSFLGRSMGFQQGSELYGMISGLLSGFTHFGIFLGPTVGSALVQYAGFDWSATFTACLAFFT